MRSLRLAVACAALFATAAMATPADPKNGAEYKTLATAQPTQVVGKKIEVLEFFAFHCPACNAMEPYIADFVKQNGHNVNFKRWASTSNTRPRCSMPSTSSATA
jgi:thiol:disulfide interchange protein DsbA